LRTTIREGGVRDEMGNFIPSGSGSEYIGRSLSGKPMLSGLHRKSPESTSENPVVQTEKLPECRLNCLASEGFRIGI
jgi:hypothetical protein